MFILPIRTVPGKGAIENMNRLYQAIYTQENRFQGNIKNYIKEIIKK
ncbi:hypothetical protein HMPREF0645_1459 [Hallella bergensis DSM 17361]|uniref:Uncharacterized protein n=1 Tax=Hallella bergensis DSM 17361 TaxID=585502 RepID=D1PWX4_9BACT|nr:hypothetical protein HMPREF0645_1459 [Hallella bergensis DSM 17361]